MLTTTQTHCRPAGRPAGRWNFNGNGNVNKLHAVESSTNDIYHGLAALRKKSNGLLQQNPVNF
jgi:hypothetical protein